LYQDLYYCKGKKNINKIRIFIKVNNCCRPELVLGSNKKAEDSENLEIPKQVRNDITRNILPSTAFLEVLQPEGQNM